MLVELRYSISEMVGRAFSSMRVYWRNEGDFVLVMPISTVGLYAGGGPGEIVEVAVGAEGDGEYGGGSVVDVVGDVEVDANAVLRSKSRRD